MDAKSRRKIEMGERVLRFSEQYKDPSSGYAAVVALLKDRLIRADQLAHQQENGRNQVRAATKLKKELRQLMLEAHLHHLTRVAKLAEDPEVLQKLTFPAEATTYLAFRTAASGMAAEAESRKELLVKHGMSEELLSDLKLTLDLFEEALQKGSDGRLQHVGATSELASVAEEIAQIVQVMDGLVRLRFGGQQEPLGAWESASNVITILHPDTPSSTATTPGSGTPASSAPTPSGSTTSSGGTSPSGDVKPAA
jgi:hypothetical protein